MQNPLACIWQILFPFIALGGLVALTAYVNSVVSALSRSLLLSLSFFLFLLGYTVVNFAYLSTEMT